MQHFKSHKSHNNSGSLSSSNAPGFSFIEIILTVALIGAVITPAFMVQYNIMNLLSRSSDNVRSIFLIDSLYSQATLQEKKGDQTSLTFEKKVEDPVLTLRYEVKPLPEKSPLKKLKNLYLARAEGTWQRAGTPQTQEEISFMFVPPVEKKEKGAGKGEADGEEQDGVEETQAKKPAGGRQSTQPTRPGQPSRPSSPTPRTPVQPARPSPQEVAPELSGDE